MSKYTMPDGSIGCETCGGTHHPDADCPKNYGFPIPDELAKPPKKLQEMSDG